MNAASQTLEALYSAGHWLVGQDRHREAVSLFRTMLLVDARDERGWLALAACHENLDEPEKAIALCELAVSACEGKAVRCTIARARLVATHRSIDEAREVYEEAARLAETLGETELGELIAQEGGVS